MTTDRPWNATVRVEEIPDAGKHIELDAGPDLRAALATPVGVDAIDRVTASFDLSRQGRESIHVSGRVSATVRQTCVVSLEPLVNEIDEEVDVVFAPTSASSEQNAVVEATASEQEVEPLAGNAIDLGVLATEFLILGVDPYPRKADAALDIPAASVDPASHPFAALAALKKATVKK
jgi:uncharacterized metal-binding protein YceD (DUF177 family)